MIKYLERFGFMSSSEPERPYLTYPVAVEMGVLTDTAEKAKTLDTPPGVMLANGYIPNSKGAGLIDVGSSIVAFDHSAIDIESDNIRISPTSKSEIANDGEIMEEGAIVVQHQNGLLRFAAFAIDVNKRPWLADRLSRNNSNRRRLAGRIAVFNAAALEMPDYEISEVDVKTSSVLVKPRIKYS